MRRVREQQWVRNLGACLLVTVLLCAHGGAQSRKALRSTTDPIRVRLSHGDTLVVEADSGFAYNKAAQHVIERSQVVTDSLLLLLHQRVSLADSMSAIRDSIALQYRQIALIQQQSYDSLRLRFDRVDFLARESTRNTDDALSYIKKVKVASFVSAGMVGAVIGGFTIKGADHSGGLGFNGWGAVGGALVGVGVNWCVLKFLSSVD